MSKKVTFDCGTFLPGVGPGNVPQFDGGGTIDAGGGADPPDPPEPPDPGDGDPDPGDSDGGVTPGPDVPPVGPPTTPPGAPPGTAPPPGAVSPGGTSKCVCVVGATPSESVVPVSPGDGNGSAPGATHLVIRTYSQTCTQVATQNDVQQARSRNNQILNAQAPPPGDGQWVLVAGPIISGGSGQSCKTAQGCGGACPDVVVKTYWRKRGTPVSGGEDAPPGSVGGDSGDGDGDGGFVDNLCVIINDSPTPNEFIITGGDSPAGATHAVTVIFPTACFPINDPTLAADARSRNTNLVNSASTQAPASYSGPWVQVGPAQVEGTVNASCDDGAGCEPIIVRTFWKRLEPDTGGDDAGDVIGEDFAGGGLIEGLSLSEVASERTPTPKKYSSQDEIAREALLTGELNLNDPALINAVLNKKPYGVQDSVIAFQTNPPAPKQVRNDSGYSEFFKDTIDSNLLYVLQNTKNEGNWDSRRAAGVTPEVIYDNLNDNVKEILDRIRNFDGSRLTQVQIFNMIGSRVLDGTLKKLSIGYLQKVAEDSEKRVPVTITRSSSEQVNEVAALSLIERTMFPLDPSAAGSRRDEELIRNWKIVPSDVDMYIPFVVDGKLRRFYINDDETFIDRVTLSLQDGNFFDIRGSGIANERLFAESEADHAFYIPESTRQKAIQILGGEAGRTLTVSADAATASGIEYDSSLSSPRQSYYLLSGVLSSLETQPSLSPSFLLKDSRMEYRLIDTQTDEGRAEADEYIKYKANKRIFVLDHEDLILDYIEQTSSVYLSQTDILFESPKENKAVPLLTRQIPWYIMVVPTNRTDYNLFNSKSKVRDITFGGNITRELRCKTSIVPEFSKRQTNKFIKYSTVGRDGVDVLGEKNTQARQTIIEVNDSDFKKTYSLGGKLVGADEYTPPREKAPIRVVREIINELDTNYELSINGIGKSLTEFDVFSRLTVKQFNKLSRLENFKTIRNAVKNGLVNNVKIIPPISKADNRISFKKTQLVQRKTTAGADTYNQIKATNIGENIVNPDENGVGGFTPAG